MRWVGSRCAWFAVSICPENLCHAKKVFCCGAWRRRFKHERNLLEADEITVPWKLVTFMERFGEQGYFANLPSNFIGKDGHSAWLCYSANYTNTGDFRIERKPDPIGSGYHLTLQEIRFLV